MGVAAAVTRRPVALWGSSPRLNEDALRLTPYILIGSLCCHGEVKYSVFASPLLQQDEPECKIGILLRRIDRERPLIRCSRISAAPLRATQIAQVDPDLCATWRFRCCAL